jgi:hypothetical protein
VGRTQEMEQQMTPLELVVDEPVVGHFYWMIVRPEHSGHAQMIIDYARGPMRSRQAASDAGARVFASYVEAENRPLPRGSGGAWEVVTMPAAPSFR